VSKEKQHFMNQAFRFAPFILFSLAVCGCTTNNISIENKYASLFEKQEGQGCFGLFDNGQGQFTIYNLKRYRDSAYAPGATFQIFHALVGLSSGSVFSDTVLLPWDGRMRLGPGGDTMAAWNKDMNLKEAFAANNAGFFQQLAHRIGRDTLQKMLDSIGYGNKNMGAAIDSFWFNNSLKISADEQLGFVKKLYFRQLPFQNREQDMVKNALIREKTDKYTLAYSTGWSRPSAGASLSWVVGWIEENQHPYFFVLNMETTHSNLRPDSTALSIVREILAERGFFKGMK
jgi:beta-lactamase class D